MFSSVTEGQTRSFLSYGLLPRTPLENIQFHINQALIKGTLCPAAGMLFRSVELNSACFLSSLVVGVGFQGRTDLRAIDRFFLHSASSFLFPLSRPPPKP